MRAAGVSAENVSLVVENEHEGVRVAVALAMECGSLEAHKIHHLDVWTNVNQYISRIKFFIKH
jgi:hypothetical protein